MQNTGGSAPPELPYERLLLPPTVRPQPRVAHCIARLSYTRPKDWFKEASGIIKYSIEAKKSCMPIFCPRGYIYTCINHIAICMCNSSKCWFERPQPLSLRHHGVQNSMCCEVNQSWSLLYIECI